ncbi:ASCH domain-containing protein [Actinoplanes sp. NBC_00393]|uniref:ASCH domain-containing protein n=1 Tax=Actinoplanes sp. NBC_00393 TaxID=2975953 RepID=UPI002E1D42DC
MSTRTTPAPVDTAAAAQFWASYAAARPDAVRVAPDYTVERFGDSAELADELLELVAAGAKRATSSLMADFDTESNPLPRIGCHWIVCDSTGAPRLVLRTTELRIGAFHSVEESFAHAEGEDDRTRESWMANHRHYWQRRCATLGRPWDEHSEEILFERFTVVFPLNLAD